MSHSKVLTEQEAREALDILQKWFETPRFNLQWSARTKRGRAYYRRGVIKVGPQCWRGTTDSLLHEFAHLLAFHYAFRRGCPLDGRGHGRTFHHALHQVVGAWYGDGSKYGWATEYKNVLAYAKREGLYKPGPSFLARLNAEVAAGKWVDLGHVTSLSFSAAGPKE